MPLGSAWWSGGWTAARFLHVFTGATLTYNLNNSVWDSWALKLVTQIWQPQFGYHQAASENTRERGRLYARRTTDGVELDIPQLEYLTTGGTSPTSSELLPVALSGDLEPQRWNDWPYYDPACHFGGSLWLNIIFSTRRYGLWALRHFQPHAYKATVAEVIAAILLHRGLAATHIDTVEFDNAYDGQVNDYGGSTVRPDVAYARETGKSIARTLMDIVRHSWDGLGFTREGKLALLSRTRPRGVAGSTIAGIRSIRWGYTDEYLYNEVTGRNGQAAKTWGDFQFPSDSVSFTADEDPNPDYSYETQWEPGLASDTKGKWSVTLTDSASVAAFGRVHRFEGGESFRVIIDRVEVELTGVHFPYFLDYPRRDSILQGWLDRESSLRRWVVLEQDLRGLDFDIGHQVTGLAVTGDGLTIADARCWKKKIDFRTLAVTSDLLEEIAT